MTTPSKETILFMLRDWIKQRPGLEPMNYGDASSYRSELRNITKDRHIPESYSRFPRTLDEAFKTARYADPLERHGPTGYPPAWWAAVCLCAIAAAVLVWVTR